MAKLFPELDGIKATSPLLQTQLQNHARSVRQLSQFSKGIPEGDEIAQASRQFEGLLLQQMMQSMWQTVGGEGLFGGHEEGLYRDMLNEALSTSISEGRGIGLRDVIEREMRKNSKAE